MKTSALAWLFLMGPMEAELKPEAVAAFAEYMAVADSAMQARATAASGRLRPAKGQAPLIEPWSKENPREAPGALIHDWLGAVFVPGAKVEDAVKVLQDIPHYPQIYSGDILTAKLLKRDGERLQVQFRVVKKKVIRVVLETEYDVDYRRISERTTQVWSRSARIGEVEKFGEKEEHVKPEGTGWGFLWRLNTYWHLEEKDGGLVMECRAISLTRDIPAVFSWIVKPMVTGVPREALQGTLEKTRTAVVAAAAKRAVSRTPRPEVPQRGGPAGRARSVPSPL